jgi:hypothetical protein
MPSLELIFALRKRFTGLDCPAMELMDISGNAAWDAVLRM